MKWMLVLVFGALTGALGFVGGVLMARHGPSADGRPDPGKGTEVAEHENSAPKATEPALAELARHSWWRQPQDAASIRRMVEQMRALEGNELLVISSDGRTRLNSAAWGQDWSAGELSGGEDHVMIVFGSSAHYRRRALTPPEALSLLAARIDAAYRSEEAFRRTGKGQTNLDRLPPAADSDR